MRERGTATSSESFMGWRAFRFTERNFRVSQISRRWASFCATITSPAASPRTVSATRTISAKTCSSSFPSASTSSAAPASGGKRKGELLAAAASATSSSSSRQRGSTPAASTRDTARAATSTDAKATSAVATCRGRGRSFSVTSVTIPSVPSLPTMSAVRS